MSPELVQTGWLQLAIRLTRPLPRLPRKFLSLIGLVGVTGLLLCGGCRTGGPPFAPNDVRTYFHNSLNHRVYVRYMHGSDLLAGDFKYVPPGVSQLVVDLNGFDTFPVYNAEGKLIGNARVNSSETDSKGTFRIVDINQDCLGKIPLKSVVVQNRLRQPIQIEVGYTTSSKPQDHQMYRVDPLSTRRLPGKVEVDEIYPIYGPKNDPIGAVGNDLEHRSQGDHSDEQVTIDQTCLGKTLPQNYFKS